MDIEKFRGNAGPSLLVGAVAGFILTRIIVWLPLGFVGSWANAILFPFIVLALLAGIALTVMKRR